MSPVNRNVSPPHFHVVVDILVVCVLRVLFWSTRGQIVIKKLIIPHNTHIHRQPQCPGILWQDVGTEYLGRLPRLLGFAIAAGRADPARGGPAPRSQLFPGPGGLFLPSTPH